MAPRSETTVLIMFEVLDRWLVNKLGTILGAFAYDGWSRRKSLGVHHGHEPDQPGQNSDDVDCKRVARNAQTEISASGAAAQR